MTRPVRAIGSHRRAGAELLKGGPPLWNRPLWEVDPETGLRTLRLAIEVHRASVYGVAARCITLKRHCCGYADDQDRCVRHLIGLMSECGNGDPNLLSRAVSV